MTTLQAANIVTKEIKTDWTGIHKTKYIPKYIWVFLECSYMKEKWKNDLAVWSYGVPDNVYKLHVQQPSTVL
jgi:hypothetical protein